MPKTDASQEPRDYVAIAAAYAKQAAADTKGKRFCKWVRLAAQRHIADLKRKGWEYRFDAWHAADVCDFIEKLPHIEGQWSTKTIHLEPPQIFILTVIFGWRRVEDGHRRFSSVYIEMARKGAKSTLTSGVALYCLCCEGEVGPQIIIGATTGEQAGKVFNPAKRMVERTVALREAFQLVPLARSIACDANGGFIQPINAKGKTQDGWNPHMGILDELHAHLDRALFDVVSSAFGSRKNPLRWIITTAGFNLAGVCYEQHQYVKKILSGVLPAEHYFGIIFSLDSDVDYDNAQPGDDPFDETKWIKANPMLGVTPTLKDMRDAAADAKASPASEGEFKTKKLNIWLSASSAWLPMAKWLECADQKLSWGDFKGLDCYIGGDLADKDDITALVLAAIDANARLIFKPAFWLPSAVLEARSNSQGSLAPYRKWHDEGHLRLTTGDWVDHAVIETQIRDWISAFSVRRVTFDQFAAAQQMASRLNEDFGTPDDPFAGVLHKNAKNVTDPAKDLEARVKIGPAKLRHDGNEVMNWMASNVVVDRRRDETLLPIKESSTSPNKIDGIDALINAMAPLMIGVPEAKRSFWDIDDPAKLVAAASAPGA